MTQDSCSEKSSFTHFNVRLEWIADSRLNATDWLILAELSALCASRKSLRPGWCYASNAHLGKFIGRSPTYISRRCAYLERIGLVTQQKSLGGQTLRQLLREGVALADKGVLHSKTGEDCPMEQGRIDRECKGQSIKNEMQLAGVQQSAIRQDDWENDSENEKKKEKFNPVSVSDFHHTPDNEGNNGNQISRSASMPAAPEQFDEFITAYPKPAQLPRARQAFREALVAGAEASDLISAAGSFAERVRQEKIPERYIPYPASWLMNQGWRDENLRQSRAEKRPMTHEEALEEIRRNCEL
jgi:hypothetical protein